MVFLTAGGALAAARLSAGDIVGEGHVHPGEQVAELLHGAGTEQRARDTGVGDRERHREVGHRQSRFFSQVAARGSCSIRAIRRASHKFGGQAMFGRHLLVCGAVLASVLAFAPAAGASPHLAASTCPACGHNLIKNPGAEAGKGADSDVRVKVPDWKQTHGFTAAQYAWSGGDLSATSPGPKDRGKNYFYGGPDSARSTGTQLTTVATGGIQTGTVQYTLAGWLGGYDSQGDHATLDVTFENASGQSIGTAHIGPVTEAQRKGISELLFRSSTGMVPSATAEVRIQLVMVREEGSDDDGLADNLSLVFKDM
jgi:hypothetical protein